MITSFFILVSFIVSDPDINHSVQAEQYNRCKSFYSEVIMSMKCLSNHSKNAFLCTLKKYGLENNFES